MKNQIRVIISFLYDEVKGKNYQWYKDKAFDEIYNSDDTLNDMEMQIEEVKK
ncbi:MAG: hypothetical protein KKF54_06770 [Candidatus Omnitrophica bacterium]|nr:hypothetical protein [Candidatus Omnitrophota bacterium]